MAELRINHAFVSTKPDSPDPSIISSSEWNAAEVATGGLHGQIIARDGTVASGLSTVHGAALTTASESYSGASPSAPLADTVINFTSAAQLLLLVTITATVSDSSNVTVDVRRDGLSIGTFICNGSGRADMVSLVRTEAAGAHTYTVVCSLGTGTFTNLTAFLHSLSIGTL